MKILYAGSIATQRSQGDTIHFLSLARALTARGHELSMVVLSPSDPKIVDEFQITEVPEVKISRIGQYFTDIQFFRALMQLGRQTQFDVLYHRAIPLANLCARLLNIPSVTEVNGIQVDELRLNGIHPIRLATFRYRERMIVRGADGVICVTDGLQKQIVDRYNVDPQRCTVIANAADTDAFYPQEKQEAQRQLTLPTDCYNIGFVGSFRPWVDFETLLQAVAILRAKGLPIFCTLIGDGPEYDNVMTQIDALHLQEFVRLPGRVAHHDIPKWLSAFDVCVAPSANTYAQSIGLSSMKLFEYLSCGRPVVATQRAGITEHLAMSNAGLTYREGNAEELAERLEFFYENPAQQAEMGRKGRAYVLQSHSWHTVAERTEQIMHSLLNTTERA